MIGIWILIASFVALGYGASLAGLIHKEVEEDIVAIITAVVWLSLFVTGLIVYGVEHAQ